MFDWVLNKLADRLGVAPARAGEAISPHVRFEQPWAQWFLVLTVVGGTALIVWLYRHEGRASASTKALLAALRTALLLLVVFMLSEAVLSVERTGLPYLTLLIDDSASQRIADQYGAPEVREKLGELARSAAANAKPNTDASAQGKDAKQAPVTAAGDRDNGANEAEGPTRLSIARGLVLKDDARLVKELSRRYKVRIYRVSTSARLVADVDREGAVGPAVDALRTIEADGAQTRLGDGVRQVLTELRGAPPSAIVVFSDGQTTDGEPLSKAAEMAARKGVPIYTVGLGSAEPARDLELTELLVDDVVFVDDAVRFQAKLSARGLSGRKTTLRLKERPDGAKGPESDRVIESKVVDAPEDGRPRRVELVHRPKTTGAHRFVLEVVPAPRELQTENNRIERSITVRKDKLKVLLVDGEPRYEFRYLKNYLERDEMIELNVVLLAADPEYSEQDRSALPTFPTTQDQLFSYDVVLIGDADARLFSQTQMALLSRFVTEKGGGVLFIAGPSFDPLRYRGTPLELLLPIDLAEARDPTAVGTTIPSYRPELTVEGRASPIFRLGENEVESIRIWSELPELYWYLEAPRKKPAALVLAEHPDVSGADGKLPLIVYQFLGAGKTMFHAFDDTWRWRFRTGDRYFGRFWAQTTRFLARSRLVGQRQAEIQTDRQRYERGQPIEIRVRFPNPGLAPANGELTVEIEREGHGPRKLKLERSTEARNVFDGILPRAGEGRYTVRLLPPPALDRPVTAEFRVDPPLSERQHIEMNQPELLRAAAMTGGKFYTPLDAQALLKDLPKPSKVPLDTDPPIPLWNTWPVLALFLGLITLEWTLRKRNQLV